MQQVLNKKDRNQTFLKFLFFFLLTTGLVVLAVYFDFRLPISENRVLQEEVSVRRQQDQDQEKFASKMQEAAALLDSLDKQGVNTDQLNSQLGGKLSELSVLQLKDNTSYGKIDKAIIDKFSELQQRKKDLKLLADKAGKAGDEEAQVANLQTQLAQAQAALDAFRRGAGGGK